MMTEMDAAVADITGLLADTPNLPQPPTPITDIPKPRLRRYPRGSDKARAVQRFFTNLVLGGAQMPPLDDWNAARTAYAASDKSLIANLWRSKSDTMLSFLDSDPAKVHFTPSDAFGGDDAVQSRAACDEAVFDYIAREQELRSSISQALMSAVLTNVGFVLVRMDYQKNLPAVIYLANEQVAVDIEAGADMASAGWVAYWEMHSPEQLAELFSDIPFDDFKRAANAVAVPKSDPALLSSVLRAREALAANPIMHRCRVWHIFARGTYALYDTEPATTTDGNPEGRPHFERFRDIVPEREPRRHVMLVEGMEYPLVDTDDWPPEYLLDNNEWPVVMLRLNDSHDSVYGFTDYKHEARLLDSIEKTVANIITKGGIEGLKLVSSVAYPNIQPQTVAEFLEKPGVQLLPNALDAAGRPLVQRIDLSGVAVQDLQLLNALTELYDQVAMQPRSARGSEIPYKTATATQIESERQMARATVRLRRFEAFIARIAKLVMQMAHAVLHQRTRVLASRDALQSVLHDAAPFDAQDFGVWEVSWEDAQKLLAFEETELVSLGVDAIAGTELAKHWPEVSGAMTPALRTVILRAVRVEVERGSTQRTARLQKAAAFREVYAQMIGPVATALGAPEAAVNAVERILAMMDLDEFAGIPAALRKALEARAAQAAATTSPQSPETPESPAAPAAPTEAAELFAITGSPPRESTEEAPYAGV